MLPRTRLGHYEILSALGKGGMGEVWKARDTKLGREVAIKTLPDAFSRDADRLARFEREAKLLASLNHSNIAAIHGLEESDGELFIVLELVEGDTLGDHLAGRAMPIDQALDVAHQIAEAIEAAHEAGVIHRDLKPANIKVTPDGRVKVLDFGLAKAFAGDTGSVNVSHSPTLSMAATQQGVILGTAAYMAPEQARGVTVDKRADIWAFGCILFEMLAGSRAFDGEMISDVMASVLKSDPDYSALQTIPPRLRAMIERCLQKDPKKRWRDIGDLRVELESVRHAPAAERTLPTVPATTRRRERALWLAGLAITAVVTGLVVAGLGSPRSGLQPASAGNLIRFSLAPPPGSSLYAGSWIVPFALSPDGRRLAFTATSDNGRSRLWVRSLDSETAQSVGGTDGATNPFWSPDSEWVAFQALNVWYRVKIPGGAPETISPFRGYTGSALSSAWGDGVIVFVNANGALSRVPVQGGQPSPLTTLDASTHERGHLWPQFLSDGRHFLYVSSGDRTGVFVDSVDGGQRAHVMDMEGTGSTIRYVPGSLFFVENGVLWVRPFDESSRRLTGERRRVTAGLPNAAGPGVVPFSVSNTGVLAYWTQSLITQAAQLQWIDRKGNRLGLVGAPAVYDGFDISPDGSQLVSAQVGLDGIEIWVLDLGAAGSSFPLRLDPRGSVPVWAPDGKRLAYLCNGSLCLAETNGTSKNTVRLTDQSRNQLAQSWTAAGDRLVYENWNETTGVDLVVLDVKTKHVDRLAWNTTSNEFGGRLSPDNQWMAYTTDQTGRNEVWVAAFPSGQPRRQISSSGGTHPAWNGAGTELYFVSAEGQLMALTFNSRGSAIEVGSPTTLFRIPRTVDVVAGSRNLYNASRDGQRFLVAVAAETASVPPINVIVNWPQLLSQ